jgi:hypothetical protein
MRSWAPQQAVNQACRALVTRGAVRRSQRADGRLGNYLAGASSSEPTGADPPGLPRESRPTPAASAGLSEDAIKHALEVYLERDGWQVEVAWGEEPRDRHRCRARQSALAHRGEGLGLAAGDAGQLLRRHPRRAAPAHGRSERKALHRVARNASVPAAVGASSTPGKIDEQHLGPVRGQGRSRGRSELDRTGPSTVAQLPSDRPPSSRCQQRAAASAAHPRAMAVTATRDLICHSSARCWTRHR